MTDLVKQANSGDLGSNIGAPVLGLQEIPTEEGGEETIYSGDVIPPYPVATTGVTIGRVSNGGGVLKAFSLKKDGVEKAQFKFDA